MTTTRNSSFRVSRYTAIVCLALFGLGAARAATTHVWSGAGGDSLFSNAANWSSGGAPMAGATVILKFPPAGTTQAVVNVSNLLAEEISITRTQFTLAGLGDVNPLVVQNVNVTNNILTTFASTLLLTFTNAFCIMSAWSNTTVQLQGRLQGSNSVLRLTGWGQYVIGGTQANTFSGVAEVTSSGTVHMGKPIGVNAFAGDVIVKHGGKLYWDAHQQLPDTGTKLEVRVGSATTGEALYIGHSESLGTLSLVWIGGPRGPFDDEAFDLHPGLLSVGRLEVNDFSEVLGADITLRQAMAVTNGLYTQSFLDFQMPLQLAANVTIEANCDVRFDGPISGAANASLRLRANPTDNPFDDVTFEMHGTNTYAGITYLDSGELVVFNANGLGTTNGGTVIAAGGVLRLPSPMSLAEPLTLIGATNEVSEGAPVVSTGIKLPYLTPLVTTLIGGIIASNQVSLDCGPAGSAFTVAGPVSGPGTFHKFGAGTLKFTGSLSNSFTGGFHAWEGVTDLQRTATATALPGPVTVHSSGTLRSLASHQIADTASVFISGGGLWDLQGFSETITNLDFYYAGTVNGFGGALQVNHIISAHDLGAYATINAALALGMDGTTVDVTDMTNSISLRLTGIVSGGFSSALTKTGSGRLELWGPNTYLGDTFVDGGTLAMKSISALGGTSLGTTVSSAAVLELGIASNIPGEWLTLNDGVLRMNAGGTNIWGGLVNVNGLSYLDMPYGNSRLILTNVVSGFGDLAKTGPGGLELGGSNPNTYAGFTWLTDGTLFLNKVTGPAVPGAGLAIGLTPLTFTAVAGTVNSLRAGQVGDATFVGLSALGVWNLTNFSDTIGALSGSGLVNLGSATLTHGALDADTTFDGQITGFIGATSLVKVGAGTFTMTGKNTYDGTTTVSGGQLIVNGTNNSALTTLTSGATLGGRGQVGNITVIGGNVSPGTSPGRLKSGSLTWNQFTTYRSEINGTNAGLNYDQMAVTGAVGLGNSTLQLAVGFVGAVSNRYTIVDNDGADAITGIFTGLPEGTVFTRGGAQFSISYVGGTGNDVVLTQLALTQGPRLADITKLPNGQIHFTATGIPNQTYDVQAATNLTAAVWESLGAATTDGVGFVEFIDSDAPNHPLRFYRFALP